PVASQGSRPRAREWRGQWSDTLSSVPTTESDRLPPSINRPISEGNQMLHLGLSKTFHMRLALWRKRFRDTGEAATSKWPLSPSISFILSRTYNSGVQMATRSCPGDTLDRPLQLRGTTSNSGT